MHQMPLEYRILTALLLGCATVSELALRLGSSKYAIEHRVYAWVEHKAIQLCGVGEKPRWGGKSPYRVELTNAGRQWAIEVIGGVE